MKALPTLRAAVLGLLCLASTTTPVLSAEPQPWEAGFGLGLIDPGNKRDIDADLAGLLTLQRRIDQTWGAEVFLMFGNDINVLGGRALYHFSEPFYGWTPYVSAGLGITDPSPGRTEPSVIVGGGLKKPINDNLGLRAELNAHQGMNSGATDLSLFFGVTWSWGGTAAATPAPAPAPVAPPPPPADSDNDGVPDSKDTCPGTPSGVKVDASGCPLDSDRDGVPDYKDQCPATPSGEKVDASGCTLDSDGDGVPDSKDDCPATPKGTKVDSHGCPVVEDKDSDGDGVLDSLDKCANTPKGAKVDADGCPVKLTEKIGIKLELNFDTGKADIKPEFRDEIDRVASFMRQYPGTSVGIEGHTDNTGSSDFNKKLSERRAEAVAQSLVKDHGIAANRVQSVGYGDTKPIADNGTATGRAENRRVTASIEETITR